MKILTLLLLLTFSTYCQKSEKVDTPYIGELFNSQNRAKLGYSFDFIDYVFVTVPKSDYIDLGTNYEIDSCLKSVILGYGFKKIEIVSRDKNLIFYKVIPTIKQQINLQRIFLQRILYQYVKMDFESALNMDNDTYFRDIVSEKIINYAKQRRILGKNK